MNPNLAPGRGVQSDDGIILSQYVHHAVDDDRIEEIVVLVTGGVGPCHFELTHIRLIDLVES